MHRSQAGVSSAPFYGESTQKADFQHWQGQETVRNDSWKQAAWNRDTPFTAQTYYQTDFKQWPLSKSQNKKQELERGGNVMGAQVPAGPAEASTLAAASLIPEQVKTLELPKSLRFPFKNPGAKISEETTYNETFPEEFSQIPHRF